MRGEHEINIKHATMQAEFSKRNGGAIIVPLVFLEYQMS